MRKKREKNGRTTERKKKRGKNIKKCEKTRK